MYAQTSFSNAFPLSFRFCALEVLEDIALAFILFIFM